MAGARRRRRAAARAASRRTARARTCGRAPACPTNAIAIHRMPAAASRTGAPVLDEREREHQHARHREEQRRRRDISQLLTSIATSLRSTTSQRGSGRTLSVAPDQRRDSGARKPVARPARRTSSRPSRISATRVHQAVGQIEIVRRQQRRWPPSAASRRSRSATDADGAIVEPGERLVEQHQPRPMQQRALEREPLPHAARKPADRRRRRDRRDRRARAPRPRPARGSRAVELGEERQVLPRRQLRIQRSSCAQRADASAAARPPGVRRRPVAERISPAARRRPASPER